MQQIRTEKLIYSKSIEFLYAINPSTVTVVE